MTTVAHKNEHIGADKRRTSIKACGTLEYNDTVTKVFKYGKKEWGQAGMVGLTELLSLHLQGLDVKNEIRAFCMYCKAQKIDINRVIGQVLVYDDGERFILQVGSELLESGKTIESADIPVPFFSIGSGSEFAFPVLIKGGEIEEAIQEAMKHDEGTGGGIDMAHKQIDKSNVVTLPQPKSVEETLKQDGYLDEDGQFTKKSLGYTSTKLLDLNELAKMGLVNNISCV